MTGAAGPDARALARSVDRLVRLGVAATARSLAGSSTPDMTLVQWRALVIATESDGLRVGEIARRIGASEPSASRLVRRLESIGLVRVERDPDDGRAARVSATMAGRRTVDAVVERRRGTIAAALASSGPHTQTLAGDVERLARSLEHLG